MILTDASVWIDHLRNGNALLEQRLDEEAIITHAFVMGELALGSVRPGHKVLQILQDLESAVVATHDEVMQMVVSHGLSGSGMGWVDAHLLASTLLTEDARLWTIDSRFHQVAERLGVAA